MSDRVTDVAIIGGGQAGLATAYHLARRGIEALVEFGQPWQHSRGSALIGFVGRDAARLAGHLAVRRPTADPLPAPHRARF